MFIMGLCYAFVVVRAAINYQSLSYVQILAKFDVGDTIHYFYMYGLFEPVLGANWC